MSWGVVRGGLLSGKMERSVEEDSYLTDMIRLVKFGGLWFLPSPGRLGPVFPYLQAVRIVVLFCIELVMAGGAVHTGPAFFVVPSSAYLTLGFVVLVMSGPFSAGHRRLHLLLGELTAGHARLTEDWQQAHLRAEYVRARGLAVFYASYTLAFTFFFPLIGFSIDTAHTFLGKEIYRYPMCLDIFDTDVEIRTWKHYVIVIVSYVWLNLLSTNNVSVIGSMFVLTGLLKGRIRVLVGAMERLPTAKGPGSSPPAWQMRDLLRFHQEIIRLHDMYTGLFGFPFATQSIVGGINTCLVGICLFHQVTQGEFVLIVLVLSYFINFQALLLLCSLEGETLQKQNDDLSFAIYNLQWYDQPTDVKKSILMMMRQAQKPLSLDFKGNVPLNLKTYSQTMSTAYSYFNIYLKSL